MSVISGIVASPRREGRFEILVDGKSFATLSLEAIDRLQLRVGRELHGLEERIATEASQLKVFDRALNMLAFRARSSAELSRALVRKGDDRAQVEHVVGRLKEQGFLDDAAFARSFVHAKVVGAKQSRRRVQQDLGRKGVARDVADAAISDVFAEESIDQTTIVEEAARKKLRTMSRLEPLVRKRRLYAFLARRGYDGDDIRRAMDAVGEELRGNEE